MTQILPQATVHQLNCSCLGAVDGGCDAGQHSHIVVPIQIADAIIFFYHISLYIIDNQNCSNLEFLLRENSVS